MNLKIGKTFIGEGYPCFIIAEIGINHNGDLDLARESIETAAKSGANAVKFQTFKAEEFVADKNLYYTYLSGEGKEVTESQYDMFRRLELPYEWHYLLKKHASDHGVEFISSAADFDSVELLCEIGVKVIKLASEDLINVQLLEHVAHVKVPVILSTGMATEEEIDNALNIFQKNKKADLILLHCVSTYPVPPEDCHLRRITALREKYPYLVGYSDHSIGNLASTLSVGLRSCIIEKHFTIDNVMEGPDHSFSANPSQFADMVKKIRLAEKMLGEKTIDYSNSEEKGRKEFRRSIVASQLIKPGSIITEDLIDYKRPGHGLKPYQRAKLLGKKSLRMIEPDELILEKDVEQLI